ncbi:hypothetical protein J6590_020164 [Homalodisca vitripennis]|nr:hypothetical protein J6590_020164 [Homalodisca vitripennis]
MYEARGRANYRTGRHRTVVYERLLSQAGVHFLNGLPNSIKDASTPKALKTRFKRFLVLQALHIAGEFLAIDWETAQLEDSLRCTKWVALATNERGVTVQLYVDEFVGQSGSGTTGVCVLVAASLVESSALVSYIRHVITIRALVVGQSAILHPLPLPPPCSRPSPIITD